MNFDVFVIGGGSGGVRASRKLAAAGLKVGLAEEYRLGGTCVIRGCVPKKLFVYASEFSATFQDAVGFGWPEVSSNHRYQLLKRAKDKEIARLESLYDGLLERHGVITFASRAKLLDKNTIQCGNETIAAKHIIIATGGTPFIPPIPGNEHLQSSNEVFEWDNLPDRIAIIGGGYIAIEFAQIFLGLGASTSLIFRTAPLLRGFDDDIRVSVTETAKSRGLDMKNTTVEEITKKADGLHLKLKTGETLIVDAVVAATGRSANTSNLGLDKAGVTLGKRGEIIVDKQSKTNVDGIYAVGDCTARMELTPVAIREANELVSHILGGPSNPVDYDSVPTAVFCQPPAAAVGMTEQDCVKKGIDFTVYQAKFRPMKNTLAGRDEKALLKLIVETKGEKVLGIHMHGPDAPEIIQSLAVAITAGLTKKSLDDTIALHPSTAEEFVLMSTPRS